MIKSAGTDDLGVVENIMEKIRSEDPSYWPYGLSKEHFNGGLYMVQKSASAEPVGFVGWQKMPEEGKSIGYYAIGILPEHRNQQFAKQAVSEVIREARSECDDVRAFIMKHNEPSMALARSLKIPVIEKMAAAFSASPKAKAIGALLGTLGTTALFDQAANPERSLGSTLQPWKWDKERSLMGGLNAILGGIGGTALANKQILGGAGAIALAPTKDLALKGIGTLHNVDNAAKESVKNLVKERKAIPSAPPTSSGENWVESIPKGAMLGAGALGVGLIGTILHTAKQRRKADKEKLDQENSGRVRITLPTKEKGDAETQIELPVGDLNLSQNLRQKLNRDYRRKLVSETKERTIRRKPKKDQEKAASRDIGGILDLMDEIEINKAGGVAPQPAPQSSVPMPPQLGQNPAMRMQQQEVAVNSIDTSTEANPAIMEAEQQAMQVQQQAEQQTAQLEQQSQQAQMQQQQQFQEQLMKEQQEKESLKLQLETAKSKAELEKVQSKMHSEVAKDRDSASQGEGTQTQKLVQNRLGRLSSRVTKVAAAPPMPAGAVGNKPQVALPPTGTHLAPGAAQAANTNEAVASGVIPGMGIYRTSYGKTGDSIYDLIFRKGAVTPKPPKLVTQADLTNSPDRMRMINQLYTSQITTNPRIAALG